MVQWLLNVKYDSVEPMKSFGTTKCTKQSGKQIGQQTNLNISRDFKSENSDLVTS